MSGGAVCRCGESKKSITDRRWEVMQYKCNHSAFSGYKWTPSDWSSLRCEACGASWRTKADYVGQLMKETAAARGSRLLRILARHRVVCVRDRFKK